MKSQFESAEHTRIREVKKTFKPGELGELTRGVRRKIREMAHVGMKKKPERQPTEVTTESQKEAGSPIKIEAVREWLSQLGNIKIREEHSETGFNFFASIEGYTLVAEGNFTGEISGENEEQALRNYFNFTTTPGTHMQKGENLYGWSQGNLTFIKKEDTERSN